MMMTDRLSLLSKSESISTYVTLLSSVIHPCRSLFHHISLVDYLSGPPCSAFPAIVIIILTLRLEK